MMSHSCSRTKGALKLAAARAGQWSGSSDDRHPKHSDGSMLSMHKVVRGIKLRLKCMSVSPVAGGCSLD